MIHFRAPDPFFLQPLLVKQGFVEINKGLFGHPILNDQSAKTAYTTAWFLAMSKACQAGWGFYGNISEDGESIVFFPFCDPG